MYKEALCNQHKKLDANATEYHPLASLRSRALATEESPGATSLCAVPANASFDDFHSTATPSHHDTQSVVTSRFDDMDSWVDDDDCFYQSLREDLLHAQQSAQSQAQQAMGGWKKVEGSSNPSAQRGAKGDASASATAGNNRQRDRKGNGKDRSRQEKKGPKEVTATVSAPVIGGRFDALAPPAGKRFK